MVKTENADIIKSVKVYVIQRIESLLIFLRNEIKIFLFSLDISFFDVIIISTKGRVISKITLPFSVSIPKDLKCVFLSVFYFIRLKYFFSISCPAN